MMRGAPKLQKAKSLEDNTMKPLESIFGEAVTAEQDNSNQFIEDFIKHAKAVSYVLQAGTLRELCAQIARALKRIYRCARVNFMLQDKDTVELMASEGASFTTMHHCYETFKVLIPEGLTKESFHFEFKFRNMTDVTKGYMYEGPVMVAPIAKMQLPDQTIMLV